MEETLDDYFIDCCGVLSPSVLMNTMANIIQQAIPLYQRPIQEAIAEEIYGTTDTCAFEKLNNINYLIFLLNLYLIDMIEYEEMNGQAMQCNDYSCLITFFQRQGIDITPLIEMIQPPFCISQNNNIFSNDGIGYMGIEWTVPPINRVRTI